MQKWHQSRIIKLFVGLFCLFIKIRRIVIVVVFNLMVVIGIVDVVEVRGDGDGISPEGL